MTIQQMKYLMAIVYAGSISEAAKQLYVAQSSVSASMRELENEFGFEREIRTPSVGSSDF